MNEVERNLKLADPVLRYLSVLVDENADLEKVRAEIDARHRRVAEARAATEARIAAAAATAAANAEAAAAAAAEKANLAAAPTESVAAQAEPIEAIEPVVDAEEEPAEPEGGEQD